jgi:hypothetical protein
MSATARATATLKKVISASRRTELVGHYPDQLAQRLRAIGPERIHTVVVWTKDPRNLLNHAPLRETLAGVGQVFLHWTITGLGATFLEPNVQPPDRQLGMLDDIVSFLGDPRRLHWRYDPLVSAQSGCYLAENIDLDMFRSLARPFARARVRTVHTSFVTMYPKVRRRLAAKGIDFGEQDAATRTDFIRQLRTAAREYGMEVVTCCEPGIPMQRCIDGALLTQLHPTRERCRTDRALGQRELCGCTVSLDVGQYLPCPNGCVYCYAHPAT